MISLHVMLDVTALGGETILTMAVLLATGFLLASRHLLTAALVAGGTASGSVAVHIGKQLLGRDRPALVDHLVEAGSASFPSGHAANSAIIYLTLALTIMQIVPSRAARWFLFGATIAGAADRREPRLSGRALAQRRACRVGGRDVVGTGMVGLRLLAAPARRGA